MKLTGHIPFRWVKGMIKWYHTVLYIYNIYMYMHCMIQYHTLWYSIIQYDRVSYSIIHIQYQYVHTKYHIVSYFIQILYDTEFTYYIYMYMHCMIEYHTLWYSIIQYHTYTISICIQYHTALYIYNINMYIQSIIQYHILFRFCMILNFYM